MLCNGGNGVESAAVFDYSNLLGADRALTVNEVSGSRHLKFSDAAAELFQFTAVVKGQFPDPAFTAASAQASGGGKRFKVKLHFVADPADGSVRLTGVEKAHVVKDILT